MGPWMNIKLHCRHVHCCVKCARRLGRSLGDGGGHTVKYLGQACSAAACNASGNVYSAGTLALRRLQYRPLHTALVGPAIVPRASPAQRPARSPMLSESMAARGRLGHRYYSSMLD